MSTSLLPPLYLWANPEHLVLPLIGILSGKYEYKGTSPLLVKKREGSGCTGGGGGGKAVRPAALHAPTPSL